MARRMIVDTICPYCGKSAYGKEYSVTKRKTKIYFHKSCYLEEIAKNKERQGAIKNAEVSSDG